MDEIKLEKLDEVYYRIHASDRGLIYEISDYFTFDVPNAKFMPSVKNGQWDGKIRLVSLDAKIYVGLYNQIKKFCDARGYLLEPEEKETNKITKESFELLLPQFNVPFLPRSYQTDAVLYCLRNNRATILSPTASGKSFIIYLLIRTYNKKTLIIVPTVSLVNQMAGDFKDYGYTKEIKKITAGVDKENIEEQVTVTTWQSIVKMPKKWFDQWEVVIGDEAHTFKAKSLTSIMSNLTNCKYRFGFTGTIDDSECQTNALVLEGLFGEIKSFVKTKELISDNTLANLHIDIVTLQYSSETRAKNKKLTYQEEMDFLVNHEKRNKFIQKLALSLKGNTLLLFQYVDKHGKELYESIKDNADGKRVFFVHGGVSGKEREEIRNIVENEKEGKKLSFGDTTVFLANHENVILTDGTVKKGKDITIDDDISDEWLKVKLIKIPVRN